MILNHLDIDNPFALKLYLDIPASLLLNQDKQPIEDDEIDFFSNEANIPRVLYNLKRSKKTNFPN